MNSSKIWRATFCFQFANISLIFLTAVIPDLQWYKKQNFALKLYLLGITVKNLCPLPEKKHKPKLWLFLFYLSSDMEEQKLQFWKIMQEFMYICIYDNA